MHEAGFGRGMRAVVVIAVVLVVGSVVRSAEKQSAAAPTGEGTLEVFQPVVAWMVINNTFDGGGVETSNGYVRDPRTGILFQLGKYGKWKGSGGNGFKFTSITIADSSYAPDSTEMLWVDIIADLSFQKPPKHPDPIGKELARDLLPCDVAVKNCYSETIPCTRQLHPRLEVQSIMTYWAGKNLYSNVPFHDIPGHPYVIKNKFLLKDPVRINIYRLVGKTEFKLRKSFPVGVHHITVNYDSVPSVGPRQDTHHGLSDDPPWP